MPDDLGSFSMPSLTAAPVVSVSPSYLLVRHEPVAARVVGAGTASAVPTGAVGFSLPEGAVLISAFEASTCTLASPASTWGSTGLLACP